eukprot:comp23117_c0_seq1/m.37228 comp23117_c0_seq1/g.37228  ORF comp23117_c0_seq1/g.37228 comp23117_c0_seq1/m.37228 type:complete len:298 (-) comp23117_c0_seq1:527-1420(-)
MAPSVSYSAPQLDAQQVVESVSDWRGAYSKTNSTNNSPKTWHDQELDSSLSQPKTTDSPIVCDSVEVPFTADNEDDSGVILAPPRLIPNRVRNANMVPIRYYVHKSPRETYSFARVKALWDTPVVVNKGTPPRTPLQSQHLVHHCRHCYQAMQVDSEGERGFFGFSQGHFSQGSPFLYSNQSYFQHFWQSNEHSVHNPFCSGDPSLVTPASVSEDNAGTSEISSERNCGQETRMDTSSAPTPTVEAVGADDRSESMSSMTFESSDVTMKMADVEANNENVLNGFFMPVVPSTVDVCS